MNRITATYEIESPIGITKAAEVMAGEQSTGTFGKIALETDELRARCAAQIDELTVNSVGHSPSLPSRFSSNSYERGIVKISWPIDNLGTSLPNLMSTIAGNLFELAELSAIRMTDIGLPKVFAKTNPGPAFGATGTRGELGAHDGPIIGTIIKPCVGLSPAETADLVQILAVAGIDFIKDDELQANGPHCPFPKRVEAVMGVLNAHADKTGKRVMYAFNITDEVDQMKRNMDLLSAHGATCAMVCMNSVGLSGLRAARDHGNHIIHGHRAGWGLYSRSPHIGISFPAWQKLWRLAGADHLHVNGLASKFTEPDPVVAESAKSVQTPVFYDRGPAHLAMPVFSSAQTIWQIQPARTLLGNDDFIFCAGGGIMSHPGGPGDGVIALRQAADAARAGISIEKYSRQHPQLRAALDVFIKPTLDLG
ncbi:ribulose-bisphosphate carboxylase large subunit family protein [Pseudohalocynthiibacter aestuariivivens]|jgi:3-oxoisoapionate-4-phosphate transcarboxylase/hydrolase|uniref:Ribulose-bisphosphate carboxylase large subunit family protein n=1 Tax=Pseudohalocynthiibacter aestuariivivens TaxID=1591409 RepID=A0ABV5JDY2_9RHOB|nr:MULTISPECIES: ribulose-bisphosphate carboxylase large subunit family protein [Pseudohalocynthiibacter]MBS9718087.1 ribulose-bisphosphate carboxylase large subunit family protein [Pseudohalocynthiibacter aestuariivivens]MCK0103298.1 ribulose-bisphosphate carboxylase large subunit family protein [Pseudohalocynthiibacter sp. F2068]